MAYEHKITGTKLGDRTVVQHNPYWILAVIPYKVKFSVSTLKIAAYSHNVSVSTDDLMATGPIVLLDNHCIRWNVSQSKSSHISSASFTLTVPEVIDSNQNSDGVPQVDATTKKLPYYNITPNDWVMFWAMDNVKDYNRVKTAIGGGEACNDKDSGLKFLGKVTSFRSSLVVTESGAKLVSYNLQCHGFKEFNTGIYYNQLAQPSGQLGADVKAQGLNNLGGDINRFIVNGNTLKSTTQFIVPFMTQILFSCSFENALKRATEEAFESVSDPKEAARIKQKLESFAPNKPLLVPKVVVKLLGLSEERTNLIYTDILSQYIGLEGRSEDSLYPRSFVKQVQTNTVYRYPDTMGSTLLKQTLNLDGSTVWSILHTYLNHPVNEIFTCMRLDPHGKIMPSMVCRQVPFNSKYFKEKVGPKITAFVDLPRWVINESYITNYNIGMDESTATNYVRVEPVITAPSGEQPEGKAALRTNLLTAIYPITDSIDIARNGLKMYNIQLGSVVTNLSPDDPNVQMVNFWNSMIADIYMKARYAANGTVVCKGIQAPITIGDNTLVKGILFHIEGVTHEGGISADGKKSFNTTLNLSYGISTDPNIIENGEYSNQTTVLGVNTEKQPAAVVNAISSISRQKSPSGLLPQDKG
jgi:hypothetical protein